MRARLLTVPVAATVLAALLLIPADAAITPTVPVTISGPGSPSNGSLDVDAAGRAVAVWLEPVDSVMQVRSATRPAGGEWSAEEDLTTGSVAVTAFAFDLNEAGDAAVVFRRADSGASQHWLWGVYRDSASPTWGSASAFGGLTYGLAQNGDFGVAVMSDGTAASAYEAPDAEPGPLSTTYRAYAGQGSASGWSGDVLISNTGHLPVNGDEVQRHVTALSIAADGAGDARVLMRMQARSPSTFDTRYRLMRTTRTTTTGWTPITPITTIDDTYPKPEHPTVAGDPRPAGGFVEAWTENASGDAVVRVNKGGDVRTFADPSQAAGQLSKHMLIADLELRNGVAAVNTYYSEAVEVGQDSVTRVGVSVWRSGTGWSDLMDPVEGPQDGAFRPDLTVHADGTVTQAYDQGFGVSSNVYVSQLPPSSSVWTGERRMSVYALDEHGDFKASVAATADGAVVIWSRNQVGSPNPFTLEAASFVGTDAPSPTTPTPTTPTPTAPSPSAPAPAPVPIVTPPPPTAFAKVKAPSVSGRAIIGRTLKAAPGIWKPTPAKVSYQWRAGTKNIKRATKPRLTLTKATRGKKISVRVTVSGSGLPSSTVTVKVKGVVR